jgi:flagellar biosynthesis protein FlhA
MNSLEREVNKTYAEGIDPVLVCPPVVRLKLRELLASNFKQLPVVSYNELLDEFEIQAVGVVSANVD